MAFANDVVGGTTLLRPAIQSPNYVPGVSGWTINRDGTSEFAGGTFRGPVVVIDPSTGVVLASIGADGNISAQNFYATGDVIIGSLSVLSAITTVGRGIVNRVDITSTLPSVPINNVLADICWLGWNVDPTRQYVLRSDPAYLQQTNSLNAENFTYKFIIAQPGGLNGTVMTIVSDTKPSTPELPTRQYLMPQFSVAGPATIKLQASSDATSGSAYGIATDTANGWGLWIEDIGPVVSAGSGGTGTPSGAQQFTKVYTALASSSWDNSGVYIGSPDGANNMYTGQLSGRTHGSNESSLWTFDGSLIASDISGATIQSARVYMYCTNSSGASGGCFTSWTPNSTPPTNAPSTGSGGTNHTSNWPVPGWGFFDCSGNLSLITSGARSLFLQDSFISGSASFYGFGTAGFRPYITITYTK